MVDQVTHIGLVAPAVTHGYLRGVWHFQSIGEIHLPLAGKVVLRLDPPAPALHAVAAWRMDRPYCLPTRHAENSESAPDECLSRQIEPASDGQRVIQSYPPGIHRLEHRKSVQHPKVLSAAIG